MADMGTKLFLGVIKKKNVPFLEMLKFLEMLAKHDLKKLSQKNIIFHKMLIYADFLDQKRCFQNDLRKRVLHRNIDIFVDMNKSQFFQNVSKNIVFVEKLIF